MEYNKGSQANYVVRYIIMGKDYVKIWIAV